MGLQEELRQRDTGSPHSSLKRCRKLARAWPFFLHGIILTGASSIQLIRNTILIVEKHEALNQHDTYKEQVTITHR